MASVDPALAKSTGEALLRQIEKLAPEYDNAESLLQLAQAYGVVVGNVESDPFVPTRLPR